MVHVCAWRVCVCVCVCCDGERGRVGRGNSRGGVVGKERVNTHPLSPFSLPSLSLFPSFLGDVRPRPLTHTHTHIHTNTHTQKKRLLFFTLSLCVCVRARRIRRGGGCTQGVPPHSAHKLSWGGECRCGSLLHSRTVPTLPDPTPPFHSVVRYPPSPPLFTLFCFLRFFCCINDEYDWMVG